MQHGKYWSCSNLANIIRGTKKPYALEWGAWDDWHTEAKLAHPFRYWVAEELFGDVQDIIGYIPDKINSFRCYLNNRFITKTHALTSNLDRGKYHEYDTRILYCLFDELVNFVEVEKAHMKVCWNPDEQAKYAAPTWPWWTRWLTEWRCDEAGIAHLDWEAALTNDEWLDKDDPDYGKLTTQAISAIELKELYTWWKTIRPNRPDPYDLSGWTALYEEREGENCRYMWNDKTDEEKEKSRICLDKLHEIEIQYDNEDEEMMIRLIKIRKSMWT